jgi:hypothetical protein
MDARNFALSRALALAVALAPAGSALGAADDAAAAAPRARAALRFALQIPRLLQLRVLGQPPRLEVTAEDLARGYVVAHGLVDILSTHRDGYKLRAGLASGPVESAELDGLARPVRADADAAAVAMPTQVGAARRAPYAVEYRLRLRSDARTGTYEWPVTLSLAEP